MSNLKIFVCGDIVLRKIFKLILVVIFEGNYVVKWIMDVIGGFIKYLIIFMIVYVSFKFVEVGIIKSYVFLLD